MEAIVRGKDSSDSWLYAVCKHKRSRSEGDEDSLNSYRPQIKERPDGAETRTYWVESTFVSPPFQSSHSSIKIKVKSCRNDRIMEKKKRGRKTGYKAMRDNINFKTSCEIVDPLIDKFSLIKARRRRLSHENFKKTVFRSKQRLGKNIKSPVLERVARVTPEAYTNERKETSEVINNESSETAKPKERHIDFEHLTVDLKRVGIDSSVDRIEDELLASSISRIFKKTPNISIPRIDQEYLKRLKKDGFIKTETSDYKNTENRPGVAEGISEDFTQKKALVITSEDLDKLKSKLKTVSYNKTRLHVPNTHAKGVSQEEAPNLIEESQMTLFPQCQESLQPPTLTPEMNCSSETPIVYFETKPDVTELNLMMRTPGARSDSLNNEEFSEKEYDRVTHYSEGSHCRQLDVFVCRSSLEDDMKDETDSVDNTDNMLLQQQKSNKISSQKESDDRHSNVSSDDNTEEISESLKIPNVQNTDFSITSSLSHSDNSSETPSIVHTIAHFTTNTDLLDSVSKSKSTVYKVPSKGTIFLNSQENGITSKSCEQICTNYYDKNKCVTNYSEAGKATDCSSNESVTVLPQKGHYPHDTNVIDNTNKNGSSDYDSCLVAKVPVEEACLNGYDSDATLVYDDEDFAKVEEDFTKEKVRNCCVFSSHNTQSNLKFTDTETVAKLKQTLPDTPLVSHTTPQKQEKTKSDQKKRNTGNSVLKVKFKTKRVKQRKSKPRDICEDLTLIISPKKNNKPTKEQKKHVKKNANNGIKLHDVFQFKEFDEDEIDSSERLDLTKQRASKRNQIRKRTRKDKLALPSIKRRKVTSTSKNKVFDEFVNIDEDDLPKILPPKRRRHAKSESAMKTANPMLASNGMERLIQEFPRHNWLENKYKSDDLSKDTPRGNRTSSPPPELYEYSLDCEENMESTEKNGGNSAEETPVINNASDDRGDRPGPDQTVPLDPRPEVTSPTYDANVNEQEDSTEENSLQIVTEPNTDDQGKKIMIPSADLTTMSDVTSLNPDSNLENSSCMEDELIQQPDQSRVCDMTQESSPSMEVQESSGTNDSSLPPVPHLIKVPEKSHEDLSSSCEGESSFYSESCISTAENPKIVDVMCTSGVELANGSNATNASEDHYESTVTITSNIDYVVSSRPATNTRKRRLLDSDGNGHESLVSPSATPDHLQLKSPKIQCSSAMDLDNFKELIAARVKNDINNQLQKTLKEFREIDQLASEKAREADTLRKLREQKLKDLKIIQQNNSETEIKRILNDRLRNMDRQNEKCLDLSSPPPAHQRPRQNIRELLDKMDRSHSQTPIDCSTFSAFSTRKTPLHSPNSNYNDVKGSSKSASPLPPIRTEASLNCSGVGSISVPTAHDNEQSCDIRASSAPALSYTRNNLSKSSFCDGRQLIPQTVSVAMSNSKASIGVKQSVIQHGSGNGFIDLSQSNGDSEVEIQKELSRALAAKRQKQDSNVSKSKDVIVNRHQQHNEELYLTKQNFQASNTQHMLNIKSKDIIRGIPQFPQNTYSNQLPRPVSYGGMVSPQTLAIERVSRGGARHSMMRPHAVRLLGAAAVGNGQQTVDGRPVYHSYATGIPINTFQTAGSIQQGTPIRPIPGIVSPTQTNTRPPFPNGSQCLENSQRLRHIPITAARNTDESQKAPHVQQAAMSTPQTAIRPRVRFRPLAPATTDRDQLMGTSKNDSNIKITPPTTDVLYTSLTHPTEPNIHVNVNGKCIVCSKFALYLCSKCQQFWYCSPQCQLKHWVTHQHNCKNSSSLS